MRFGIIPPVRSGVTADPAWMTSFARHAESCGFESVVLVEHAVVVSDYQSTYPYSSSGRMPLPDDCRIPDPLDLMAYLAGVTDAHHPGHRGAGAPQSPGGRPGQADRHRRRAVGGPGPDVCGRGVDGRGAAGHRGRPAEPGTTHRRDHRRHAGPVGRLRPGRGRLRRRVRLLPPRPFLPQAGPTRRGAHPHRWPQRGGGPPGRSARGRLPAPGTRPAE